MNCLCVDCGQPIDFLNILFEGEKLFGPNKNDKLLCWDCYFIKNPLEEDWSNFGYILSNT
jgi:hypothetical protein